MIDKNTSLADVAGAVAAALRAIDVDPVVVGGSAATVHAPDAYRSDDIDLVVVGGVEDNRALIAAMEGLGFQLAPGHLFAHDRSPYTVEFVPSPVAIGYDIITDFARVPTAFGDIQVLHAADVVADRLNKSVAYEDPDAFEVAVAVARATSADLDRVSAFIKRQAADVLYAEAFHSAFRRLQERLRSA